VIETNQWPKHLYDECNLNGVLPEERNACGGKCPRVTAEEECGLQMSAIPTARCDIVSTNKFHEASDTEQKSHLIIFMDELCGYFSSNYLAEDSITAWSGGSRLVDLTLP
jgi:hypothetical protein